ncbi:MarR family winged helix-turn-helix transcriptional regulator [Pedobacter sp. SYSU D00535]|uniref:MarR family winged helix-turn-helix transcriptional regulator n=1 Tax=Pedobacter sp. SYSU D00535 TaxID=2810308 RepID=UPI001A970541|nr:winged helix DNA-binding protein [Pedobacter sp. SYSU D00535]
MSYALFRELIKLTEEFEIEVGPANANVSQFSKWLNRRIEAEPAAAMDEPVWEGKEQGRTPESVINTLLVHLFRYAKIYSKLAIAESPFATIDDVIFLINLRHRGAMTKIELIELNIHEKSTGIQIINRLISSGFVAEAINPSDKRSKKICITEAGIKALEANMDSVRAASKIVVGDLNKSEKLQLIGLLQKLETFHASNRGVFKEI